MTFDQILPQLKEGCSVTRKSWVNKIVELYEFPTFYAFLQTDAYGQMNVWTPTVEDILADDWRVVDAQ